MNNNERDLFEKFKEITASYNFVKENVYTPQREKRRMNFMKKKIIATTCAGLILTSGIAIATNFENIKNHFSRGLGEGVDTAIDNGYIAKPQMEFVKLDNVDAKVKIEDFVMDDVNLSTNFTIEFGENIKDSINMEKINEISLSDLIVRDEENRIIYSNANKEKFDKYCKENNLEYAFEEFNENYMNSGISSFITSKDNNSMNFMYNMYTSSRFPKSKKLYFSFETILLKENVSEKEIKYELNGAWNTTVDVTEEMYNRTEEYYRVISCDNKDFDVYAAKVTNTGFELGVIISNIEKPLVDDDIINKADRALEAYNNNTISAEEYLEESKEYIEFFYLNKPISISTGFYSTKQTTPSYIQNQNGKKFECSFSDGRTTKYDFIDGNRYDFYETFSMTKYEATDKVKVILYYYEQPVTIELEKIK